MGAGYENVTSQMADLALNSGGAQQRPSVNVVMHWKNYIGRANLSDWQRYCHNVGVRATSAPRPSIAR
jgi:hypothetical protein